MGLLFIGMTTLMSCKKADKRDQYVGTWQYKLTGSTTFYQSGQVIGTAPADDNGTVSISKSGDNDLYIIGGLYPNGKNFTVNGDKISTGAYSVSGTENGVNIVGTEIDNGTLGSNLIVIDGSITGTWNNSNNANGNFSGSVTATLTK